MRAVAAVGVDDDLAARETAVTLRTAHHEATRRVDEELGADEPFGRNHRTDDFFDDGFREFGLHLLAVGHFWGVLRGDHDRVAADGLAVDVAQRDLALGVGTQEGKRAVAAHDALALHQTMGVVDRGGHEGRRFVAGEAEHEALVAGAEVEFVVHGLVDALGDVLGLLVVADENGATLVVDAVFGVVVTDALENVAGEVDVVDGGAGGDFTGHHDETGRAKGFRGDAAHGVLRKAGVKDGVRDLVGHFVGMTFTDGFGSKQIFAGHSSHSNGLGTAPSAMKHEVRCGRRFSGISSDSPRKLSC